MHLFAEVMSSCCCGPCSVHWRAVNRSDGACSNVASIATTRIFCTACGACSSSVHVFCTAYCERNASCGCLCNCIRRDKSSTKFCVGCRCRSRLAYSFNIRSVLSACQRQLCRSEHHTRSSSRRVGALGFVALVPHNNRPRSSCLGVVGIAWRHKPLANEPAGYPINRGNVIREIGRYLSSKTQNLQ